MRPGTVWIVSQPSFRQGEHTCSFYWAGNQIAQLPKLLWFIGLLAFKFARSGRPGDGETRGGLLKLSLLTAPRVNKHLAAAHNKSKCKRKKYPKDLINCKQNYHDSLPSQLSFQ